MIRFHHISVKVLETCFQGNKGNKRLFRVNLILRVLGQVKNNNCWFFQKLNETTNNKFHVWSDLSSRECNEWTFPHIFVQSMVKTQKEGYPQRILSKDVFWPETGPFRFTGCHLPSESMGMYLFLCKAICSVGLLSAQCHWITTAVTERRNICPKSHKGQPFRVSYSGILFWHVSPWASRVQKWGWGREVGNANSENLCRNSSWSYKKPHIS